MTSGPTLTLGRLSYSVEPGPTTPSGETTYLLRGKRGAVYATMRNVHRPETMFVYGAGGIPRVFDGVWLTDADGTLRVRGVS